MFLLLIFLGLISWDPETKTGVLKDIKNDELHIFEIDSWEDSSNLDNYFNDHEIEFHSAHQIIESGSSKLKAFKVRAPSAIVEGKVHFLKTFSLTETFRSIANLIQISFQYNTV